MAAVDDEIVPLRLACDGVVDGAIEQGIVIGAAKRRAQVGCIVLTKAHVERAGACQPYTVAAFAEIVRERRDESQTSAGLGDTNISRRTAGAIITLLQSEVVGQAGANERQGQILIHAIAVDLAERHGLDQREIEAAS